MLCNPVDKDGEGILDPGDHLACFLTDPFGPPLGEVRQIRNQFHTTTADIDFAAAVCLPSTKTVIAPP